MTVYNSVILLETGVPLANTTVSYTHLDVYKRQALHHLYLPKTKDRIDILIEQLPERERNAVLAINSGTTYRQLAEQLGVSYNRAQQLVNRGELQIRRWLRQSS